MATLPPETILQANAATHGDGSGSVELTAALAQLQGQAGQLAMLARLAPEQGSLADTIAAAIDRSHPWQRLLVAQAIADNAAMLRTGLDALGTLMRRGQDPAAPALALWREFHAARMAMLAVLDTSSAT